MGALSHTASFCAWWLGQTPNQKDMKANSQTAGLKMNTSLNHEAVVINFALLQGSQIFGTGRKIEKKKRNTKLKPEVPEVARPATSSGTACTK